MRKVVSLIYIVFCISTLPVFAQEPFLLLNIHDGLAESRVRCMAELPDGRMAVATTATVDIFDGTAFRSFAVSPQKAYALDDYHAYRRMAVDDAGRLWLHNKGSLHVIMPDGGGAVNVDSVFAAMGWHGGRITAFFIDNGHGVRAGATRYWAATADGALYFREGGQFRRVANLKALKCGVPEKIISVSNRIFLCFSTGRVCELNRDGDGARMVFSGMAVADSLSSQLRHGISARIINGSLWLALNHKDEHHAFLTRLDLANHEWLPVIGLRTRTSHMEMAADSMVYIVGNRGIYIITPDGRKKDKIRGLPVEDGNRTFSVSDDMSSIVFDRYGGIWVGATESGLLYRNHRRGMLIHTDSVAYPHRSKEKYCSQRAKEYAERIAPGLTNCTAETPDGLLYIGTRTGLVVVDALGNVAARMGECDGFKPANIQSLLVVNDDVWVATPMCISCVTPVGAGGFELRHYGRLDGLCLGGRELLAGKMFREDSTGIVRAGFGGGMCSFCPDSLKKSLRYVYRHEKDDTVRRESYAAFFFAGMAILLVAVLLFVCARYRKGRRAASHDDFPERTGASDVEAVTGKPFTVPTEGKVREILDTGNGYDDVNADELFLVRLRETVEAHLSDECFSVQSLASEMAMDRTGLFRRVQALTGQSPSAYIRTIRMNVAARLLGESNMSVADIASRTGFSSAKYFSRIFKDTYGMLPKDYRRDKTGK